MRGKLLIVLLFTALFTLLGHYCFAYKLTPYIPRDNPNKMGVIVCPGGSYFWLDKENEGHDVAKWLSGNGIAAFVLEYRHAGWWTYAFHLRFKKSKFPAAYEDFVDALEKIREGADHYDIDPNKIGAIGFSAGGHLVMHAAEQLASTNKNLFFVAPIYPVVSMDKKITHRKSRRGLLGELPSKFLRDSLSLEKHVPYNCPPVFLVSCEDDKVVDYRNSVLLDSALTEKQIPHLYLKFSKGGHGFGISDKKTTEEAICWKESFINWITSLLR